jgi:hypothetical protein
MARKKPKPTPTTYSWIMGPKRHVYCFTSTAADQTVSKLWEVDEFTDFHDAQLGQATNEINAILSKLKKATATRSAHSRSSSSRIVICWSGRGMAWLDLMMMRRPSSGRSSSS